jgi:limonene-1,2-epoxide hydrolase
MVLKMTDKDENQKVEIENEKLRDSMKGRLSSADVLKLWSKTYNTDGKPDWSHIFPYYDENIVFQDSIQHIEGIDEFIKLCNRLTKRCSRIDMDILNITEDYNTIMMDWKMTMSFRKSPSTPIYGCTKLTFNEEGKIIGQRDYYDLWGDIFNGIPGFRRFYRWFMSKFFG